jgi:hypothetical protein
VPQISHVQILTLTHRPLRINGLAMISPWRRKLIAVNYVIGGITWPWIRSPSISSYGLRILSVFEVKILAEIGIIRLSWGQVVLDTVRVFWCYFVA